ncbi:hypothetical protein Dimus_006402 [Dionaea muscipula]
MSPNQKRHSMKIRCVDVGQGTRHEMGVNWGLAGVVEPTEIYASIRDRPLDTPTLLSAPRVVTGKWLGLA